MDRQIAYLPFKCSRLYATGQDKYIAKMILYLKALSKEYIHRDFICSLDSVELACDVLNHLVSQGEVLIEASLVEEGYQIKLPLEVFDGQSFQTSLQELEQQWMQVLNEPTHVNFPTDETQVLINRWDLARQLRIKDLQAMIQSMQTLLDSTTRDMSEGALRSRLISRYEAVLRQQNTALAHLYRCQVSSLDPMKPAV